MSLADLLAEESRPAKKGKLDIILEQLSAEDRATFVAALRDESVPSTVIARALTKMGYPIGDGRIRLAREKFLDRVAA